MTKLLSLTLRRSRVVAGFPNCAYGSSGRCLHQNKTDTLFPGEFLNVANYTTVIPVAFKKVLVILV
jgi:hypothetical protein